MSSKSLLRRLVTDPLLIFLLLGIACFTLYARVTPEQDTIVVTPAIVAALEDDYLLLEGRAADAQARSALIERYVHDEILFREALARGLHLNDSRTRHRLIDKMRFLLDETPAAPTPQDLLDYYETHADAYYTENRLTFDHIFFETGHEPPADTLARLTRGERAAGDDEFWIGSRFDDYHASMLRSIFGGPFVDALLSADQRTWVGPLESARGIHFVRVEALAPPRLIPFEEALERLEGEWTEAAERAAIDARVEALAAAYEVRVES